MKLKDDLVLRKVADQYVIVPVGKRVQEVTSIVYISSSAAYLWDFMKDNEFEKKDLIKRILEHYIGVTEEKASADIERFLKILSDNNILDNGQVQGSSFIRVPKEMLDKLWPSKNEDKGDGEQ
ncbi:PqqD family protein [Coprobacillaceae bacterium CR2/5/TPMF4]|nr:PqqD family protein [Coprobacillaceae bacterium CR2/5/TPMF4]